MKKSDEKETNNVLIDHQMTSHPFQCSRSLLPLHSSLFHSCQFPHVIPILFFPRPFSYIPKRPIPSVYNCYLSFSAISSFPVQFSPVFSSASFGFSKLPPSAFLPSTSPSSLCYSP
ncbi:hypothetical protein AB6A40_011709 [Gnathostoma spinigerum]|uniref:Uncharacterized protein n=1 Tax=Gnathostoma spinigerum TaxID=75299 RepID=A0ABD6EZP3_9BILA